MSDSPEVSRRDFLKAGVTAGAVAGVGLGGFYFGYNTAIGSPVRVGVIGTGDEGSVLIGAMNPDFIEVKAIADIRPYNQFRAFHGDCAACPCPARADVGLRLEERDGSQEAREGLRPLPGVAEERQEGRHRGGDHRHAAAPARPGRDRRHEAGAARDHREADGATTSASARRWPAWPTSSSVYLAIGHQRHYNIKYWQAKDWIQRGLLGELHSIRAQWHRSNLPPRATIVGRCRCRRA